MNNIRVLDVGTGRKDITFGLGMAGFGNGCILGSFGFASVFHSEGRGGRESIWSPHLEEGFATLVILTMFT
jgi:hypothetical protein